MESPASWDLLTASLAVSDLSKPESAWSFLVVQGLVQNERGDRSRFLEILQREEGRGPITGPSLESRVASGLSNAEITTPAAIQPDPEAATAQQRMKVIRSWHVSGGPQKAQERPG